MQLTLDHHSSRSALSYDRQEVRNLRGDFSQVVEDGYEFFAKRQLVTIFSAPNYCGEFDNAGAMMSVDETLMCSFQVSSFEYPPCPYLTHPFFATVLLLTPYDLPQLLVFLIWFSLNYSLLTRCT